MGIQKLFGNVHLTPQARTLLTDPIIHVPSTRIGKDPVSRMIHQANCDRHQADLFTKGLRNPEKLTEGEKAALATPKEQLKKPFELEPLARKAMTARTEKESNDAWDELSTKFVLGTDPTEAVKTMAFLQKEVKQEGSFGSLKAAPTK